MPKAKVDTKVRRSGTARGAGATKAMAAGRAAGAAASPRQPAARTLTGKRKSVVDSAVKPGAAKAPTVKPGAAKPKSGALKAATAKSSAGKAATAKPSAAKTKAKTTARSVSAATVSQEVARKEMELLCKLYPEADCELDFESPFQLLTSVILSAQTTDANVNRVTPLLFKKYPTARALAEAPLDAVKEIVRPTGYFNAKATNIQRCAQALVERFGGEVPKTLEELTTLPGVGRKTANVVLGVAYGVPGWTVDTHVQRLAMRLGFTAETDPYKIELDLQKLFPGKDWSKYSITIIWHGRRLCFARKPNCAACPVNQLCPASQV